MSSRTLTLDLGNSTLAVGLFEDGTLVKHLHFPTATPLDQLVPKILRQTGGRQTASTARGTLRTARSAARKIQAATLSSVVPERTAPLLAKLETVLGLRPLLLSATSPHGLAIGYRRPAQLGADRVAAALGARKLYPQQNCVIVDCGTATTLTFLTREGQILGGAILPGLALWPAALAQATAKLPTVKLPRPPARDQSTQSVPPPTRPIKQPAAVATDTAAAIRAGALYGHAGAIRELATRGALEAFGRPAAPHTPRLGRANETPPPKKTPATIIGTGGQAPHFAAQSCFTVIEPALTLYGLQAYAAAHA